VHIGLLISLIGNNWNGILLHAGRMSLADNVSQLLRRSKRERVRTLLQVYGKFGSIARTIRIELQAHWKDLRIKHQEHWLVIGRPDNLRLGERTLVVDFVAYLDEALLIETIGEETQSENSELGLVERVAVDLQIKLILHTHTAAFGVEVD